MPRKRIGQPSTGVGAGAPTPPLPPEEGEAKVKEKGFFCRVCNYNHIATFDGPGVGHWPIPRGSKAELIFNLMCKQPRTRIIIPLQQGEKPGALASPQINGLKIGIFKGAYVEVPHQLAEIMMDSIGQTEAIPFEAKTAPNPFTGQQNYANLARRSEADRGFLNA